MKNTNKNSSIQQTTRFNDLTDAELVEELLKQESILDLCIEGVLNENRVPGNDSGLYYAGAHFIELVQELRSRFVSLTD